MKLLALGPAQFIALATALLSALLVIGILLSPALHVQYIQEFGIKGYESQYGFRTGQVVVQGARQSEDVWGIVWVAPDGPFARLGVRGGDIPFEHHNGVMDMYAALKGASSGHATVFQVHNGAEAHLGRAALRQIRLPPAGAQAPAPR